MAEIERFLTEFNNIIDPKAKVYGSDVGERGIVSKIMHNADDDIFYYLHYRREWFRKFGALFRKTIPADDTAIQGTSIPVRQLERAAAKKQAWIVICKENSDFTRSWLGCNAKIWYDYFLSYKTLHRKEKSNIDEIPEACIPITLLSSMKGFKK